MALAYLTAQSRPKRLHVHAADAVLARDGLFRGATKGIEILGNANDASVRVPYHWVHRTLVNRWYPNS